MDLAVAPGTGDARAAKKGRHELLISSEFPPLESIDFLDPPHNSFYNTIELPPTTDLNFAWPDLTAQYAPFDDLQAETPSDTDDSKECHSPLSQGASASSSQGLHLGAPIIVSDESEHVAVVDETARAQLRQLIDSESHWRDTLDHLARHYSPGTVLNEVQEMEQRMRDGLTDINKLLENSVMHVSDVFEALNLKGRYENVLHQAEILEQEELFHMDDHSEPVVEDLVAFDWIDQPLGKSFKNKNRARATNKKKKGHCKMTARIVCAPGVTFSPSSAVTAHFYQVEDDDVVARKGRATRKRPVATPVASVRHEEISDVQIQNNTEKLSKNNLVSFDFRFPAGTRNKPCNIRLHVKGVVTLPDGTKSRAVEIISQPTNRFIITTNECQFETAELKLMLMEIFEDNRQTCSWSRFVNALNVRWMRVTRQEADSGIAVVPDRALTPEEFRFVASFFPNAPHSVTREEVSAFYSFFGKATHHYRHNLAFRQLMMDGLVWGFMSKSESARLLSSQPDGTFVIRASESSPGCFCLSWKADSSSTVRHGLLDVKCFQPPMLADFLMRKSFLKAVLRPAVGKATQITLRDKEAAFGPFVNAVVVKKESNGRDEGYLDLESLM